MKVINEAKRINKTYLFNEMPIGSIGIITESPITKYLGNTVYKVSSDIVTSLNDNSYWTQISGNSIKVELVEAELVIKKYEN